MVKSKLDKQDPIPGWEWDVLHPDCKASVEYIDSKICIEKPRADAIKTGRLFRLIGGHFVEINKD